MGLGSAVAVLEGVLQGLLTAVAASLEVYHEIVFVFVQALLEVDARRGTV